uniref:Uncharacterized protein n=1 Tax=Panagrolaimus davidi TaxID=227884 RepID=A0A914NXD9_9BILA
MAIKADDEEFLGIKCVLKDKNMAIKIISSESQDLQVDPAILIVENVKGVSIRKSKDCSDEAHITILYKPVPKDVKNAEKIFATEESGIESIKIRIYTPVEKPPLLKTEKDEYRFGPDHTAQIGLQNDDKDCRVGIKCSILENGNDFTIDPKIAIVECETTLFINIKRNPTTKSSATLVIECYGTYSVETEIKDLEYSYAMDEIKVQIH